MTFMQDQPTPFEASWILWQDDDYLAAWKPNHLLVHKTHLDFYTKDSLRDRIQRETGEAWEPCHRLDKPTSGIVLFAKGKEVLHDVQKQFIEMSIKKRYLALMRGFVPECVENERPLRAENELEEKSAHTIFEQLASIELPWSVGKYPHSRYSLVNVYPQTGRYHQIRQHAAQLRHPIIGDHRHGDVKHNSYFKTHFTPGALYLHAYQLEFKHHNGITKSISAPLPYFWTSFFEGAGWIDRFDFKFNPTGFLSPE
ncbi:MAG: pseudouridine synthase [Bacteroidetes bacterium]|nr:pseudouridine synthase [Bacteroidota bacterium]